MAGYGIIFWIVVGLVAGFIAEKVMGGNQGLLMNLVVGIIGALVGGFLADALSIEFAGWIGNIVIATIGAIIFLWALKMFKSR